MQTFWLVRHAHRLDFTEPEWFESAIYPYDPPLSLQGVEQAEALAVKFSSVPIDSIFTSPFLRTIQTVDPLVRLLQLPIRLEWGLCEWLCQDWTTELPKTTPMADLLGCYPNIDGDYQSLVMPCYPETIAALNIRLNTIAHKLIQSKKDRILAIAHKGSVLGIASALTGNDDWRTYDLPCGGIIKLVSDGEIWSGIIEG
ncbi:histidine phosphatase family protein [Chamaesiphon sp. VAR_48_metabat_403]|uniref:histidine phosphatase family protein n=1 Tax=Chamaesiphon sp. VAR_48_metabat_403 TaxID=2964700 RepID=UPI00286E2852|nr:histidine phosphatase family protein [Chamaesiphon sp. VAR_48_metabat_403]